MLRLTGRLSILCVLVVLALPLGAWPQASALSQYAKLLERVKGGDLSIDFKQLRFSYMDSPEYDAAKDTENETKAMIDAMNAEDFVTTIKNADVVLANDYVDMDAHFAESIAHRQLHHDAQADFHKAVFTGLLRSIAESGDGKSEKTAYTVIRTHEEYVLLRVRGLVPGEQTLKTSGGHHYDVMEAKDPKTDASIIIYFNVDVPIKHHE